VGRQPPPAARSGVRAPPSPRLRRRAWARTGGRLDPLPAGDNGLFGPSRSAPGHARPAAEHWHLHSVAGLAHPNGGGRPRMFDARWHVPSVSGSGTPAGPSVRRPAASRPEKLRGATSFLSAVRGTIAACPRRRPGARASTTVELLALRFGHTCASLDLEHPRSTPSPHGVVLTIRGIARLARTPRNYERSKRPSGFAADPVGRADPGGALAVHGRPSRRGRGARQPGLRRSRRLC